MTRREVETSVLVVGAGPVGLTLALDLARRGVDVTVAELRHPGEPPSVKCNHVAARSMEIFRRLGVAAKLRDAGLPPDYPNDVAYRTTTTGMELSRIPIPCRRDRYSAKVGPDTWWPTPEPPHRINQIFLEPVLFRHAATQSKLRIVNRVSVDDLTQDADSVSAVVRDLDSGDVRMIRCRYLVGCDGGRSTIRRCIGANLAGTANVQRVQSTYIRAPDLLSALTAPPAWATFSLNPRRSGNVYAIDGRETWLIHNYLLDDEADADAVDRDWAIRTILGVPPEFRYEVLSKEDWVGRRLIADKFRDRRVFLCGDAAHIWVPFAGYGMNAGIADAGDLAWLLAADLDGWAGERALDAYEAERLPITEQVSHFAMNHAQALARQRSAVSLEIEQPGPEGDAVRAATGKALYDLNVQQYCCGGLNFGYYYDASPIIAYDGEAPPPYSMATFTPSTVPGCRTPHIWLKDGRSLYDALGPDYTLLRFDASLPVDGVIGAARERGVPLALVDVEPRDEKTPYDRPLVLSRPDQHVAWRGTQEPSNSLALIDRIRGA
ncbi:MAG TPA: FAD-dependent oxidoreductase [Candidatus Cybelea sp.]|nr:FAD-dependent oxidoreductase [Candidatus Cybelea sp.]